MKQYNPKEFEAKWIEYWQKEQVYKTPSKVKKETKKAYLLSMFPYPSGAGLHVGHVRIYTGTDVMARYFRMKGYAVLHPMGWDAFGLPAENAAIKAQKNPMDMVPKNILNFKRQMQMLGLSYDWNKEFATSDPEYYRWTQWLFIQFFKSGLLDKKDTSVYFCPACKTGLSEEEALPNGTHERCGKQITRKNLPQWIFKITKYADSLLAGLKDLDWPKGILEMQRNWIGKDKGLTIEFKEEMSNYSLPVWTRFWETVFGTTFLVLAPEHGFIDEIKSKEVQEYVRQSLAKTDEQRMKDEKNKTGVFTGHYAINPVNNQKVPIWVADYVLGNVGTGAVMGVPAHDKRDFSFAKKHGLAIIPVVEYIDQKINTKVRNCEISHEGPGVLINSGQFNGQVAWEKGKQNMAEWMINNGIGKWKTNYHLRDWIFSRQRYWGEPIPIIYCPSCAEKGISYFSTQAYMDLEFRIKNSELGIKNSELSKKIAKHMAGYFPIPENELPLELPYLKQYEPTGTGESPLANAKDWLKTKCPQCGSQARRETDTMPNWAGSCWYFLRFAWQNENYKVQKLNNKSSSKFKTQTIDQIKNKNSMLENCLSSTCRGLHSEALAKEWKLEIGNSGFLPVDWYLGGAEHAVLHLLYARFWGHVLNDIKLLDFREPFKRLRNVGMVLAEDHRKMSKSWGNVINPDDVIVQFGADALRLYEMFMAPFDMEIAWSIKALQGLSRFLRKVYQTVTDTARIAKQEKDEDKNLVFKLQTTINKVGKDIANVKFNTAIAALMTFINAWQKGRLGLSNAKKYLKILAPFAPFLAEELWQKIGKEKTSVHLSSWPKVEDIKLDGQIISLPVQVNGKLRALLKVKEKDLKEQASIEAIALKNEKVSKYLIGKKYKLIYVPNKILNFIV